MRAIIKRKKRILYYNTSPCESEYVSSYRNGNRDLDRKALIRRYRQDICGIHDKEPGKRRTYGGGHKMFIIDLIPEMINVIGLECEALSKSLNFDYFILNKWRRDHKNYVEMNAYTKFLEWKSPAQPDATSFNLTWEMKVKIIISDTEYPYEMKDLKFREQENATLETSPGKGLETLCQTPNNVSEDPYKDQLSKLNQDYEEMKCNYTSEKNKCVQQSA